MTIRVASLRPGSTQAAFDAFNLQVSQFEAKYPWITIEAEEYDWTAPTFTAALAAGTLPDVYTIPFTDGKGLIAQSQLVDIDARVRALPLRRQVQPERPRQRPGRLGQDLRRADPGLRHVPDLQPDLFTQAGLDPDKPPTTWDEVRAAAKTIAEKTKVAGLLPDGHLEHRRLAADHPDLRPGRADGGHGATARPRRPSITRRPRRPSAAQGVRWTDGSMGATFDYDWGKINQAYSSGQIGMFVGGSDLFTAMVQNNSLNPADYGVTTIPLASDPNAGVLGGGTLAAVNVATYRGPARRGGPLDRLLLHEQAQHAGRCGRGCQGARRQQAARRRPGPADLRQGDV